MEQEVVTSRSQDVQLAVSELCSKLKRDLSSYNAVFFMAAINYDFASLSAALQEKFPKAQIIGSSTAGEITPQGFTENSVVLTTMYSPETRVSAVLVENGSKYPVSCKTQIEQALSNAGIRCNDRDSHKDAFAIAFINGVFNAEETILTNFYSIIKNDNFKLAGGTAGFTGNTAKTFVCCNGKTTQDGAAMMFVKTRAKFDIRQEDIFNPTGKTFFVGSSDPVNRIINSLDGKTPKAAYAQKLGVSESQAEGMTFENPFGRFLNGAEHIAALAGFTPDGKITTFARVVPNSTLELMHIGDPLQKADETCRLIRENVPNPKFVLLMTCITRTVAFANMGISSKIIDKYNAVFPTFAGFSCYGEQLGRIHCNQTLVALAIGD